MDLTAFGPYALNVRTNISSYGPRARLIRAYNMPQFIQPALHIIRNNWQCSSSKQQSRVACKLSFWCVKDYGYYETDVAFSNYCSNTYCLVVHQALKSVGSLQCLEFGMFTGTLLGEICQSSLGPDLRE